MADKTAGTTTIKHSAGGRQGSGCETAWQDLEEWPRSWMGMEKDLAAGERIVESYRPFLAELAGSGLSRKTIRKHVDNLWVLGGEIIRDLNQQPGLRKRPVKDVLFDSVEEGGLLPRHLDTEEQMRSFESTCRRLRRFLEQQRQG